MMVSGLASAVWPSPAQALDLNNSHNFTANSSYYLSLGVKEPIGNASGVVTPGADKYLSGAYSSNNSLTVSGLTAGKDLTIIGGANVNQTSVNKGDASNNKVVVTGSEVGVNASGVYRGSVVGGATNVSGAQAAGNAVEVTNSLVWMDVNGGVVDSKGLAQKNSVKISNVTVGHNVYGGVTRDNGAARDNLVSLDRGSVHGSVYGGSASTVSGNEVKITNSSLKNDVVGGRADGFSSASDRVEAANNKVTVTGASQIAGAVHGGRLGDKNFPVNGSVTGNQVLIDNENGFVGKSTDSSPLDGVVAGGYSFRLTNATLDQNQVTFKNGYANTVTGGFAEGNGTRVSSNKVVIQGGQIGDQSSGKFGVVAGGYVLSRPVGSSNYLGSGQVVNNSVEFVSGVANKVYGGFIDGRGAGEISGNHVSVTGGNISKAVYGGAVGANSTGTQIRDNLVVFAGGQTENVYGGFANENGNSSEKVIHNTVSVKGGQITGEVIGGRASLGLADNNSVTIEGVAIAKNVYGGFSTNGSASGNQVKLLKARVANNVYGGLSSNATAASVNNRVELQGARIGGDLVAGTNLSAAANNTVIFQSGLNAIGGTVNASRLVIADGQNTLNKTANLGTLTIAKGTSVFNGGAVVSGEININDGVNVFKGELKSTSGDLLVKNGRNEFQALSASGAGAKIAFAGGTNLFKGDLTASNVSFNSGSYTFANTSKKITTAAGLEVVAAGGAQLILADSANLTLNNPLRLKKSSSLTALGKADLAVTGAQGLVVEGGQLSLGTQTVRVHGNLTFHNGSSLVVETSPAAQGQLNVSGNVNLNAVGDKISVDLSDYSRLNPTQAVLVGAGSTFAPTNGSFYNPMLSFNVTGQALFVDFKAFSAIQRDLSESGVDLTRNDRRIMGLMSQIEGAARSSSDPALLKTLVELRLGLKTAFERNVVEAVLRQSSGESVANAQAAVLDTSLKSQGVVFRRLDRIHEDLGPVPPAAGQAADLNRVWVGGFHSWARQRERDSVSGYEYKGGGLSLGYDRQFEGIPGLSLGLVGTLASGELDSERAWASLDSHTWGLGVYGGYEWAGGLFVDASLAYSQTVNDSKVRSYGGWKSGDFDINSWQVGARVGQIFDLGSLKVTPTVGLRYTRLSQEGFAERLHGSPMAWANYFKEKSENILEIPFLVKLNGSFETGAVRVSPELRLGWTLVAHRPTNQLTVGFQDARGFGTTIYGLRPSRSSLQAGAGVKVAINDQWDIFANYDVDVARGLVNHNAALGVGFNF
jgi:outer membrane autotransporter protein